MAITYPLTPPSTGGFRGISMTARAVVGISRSPFSLEAQVQAQQGQMWLGQFTLPPLRRADGEPWLAFLLSLNGPEGTFLAGIEGGENPRGALGGSPLVKGGGQSGQVLLIDGCTPNITGWAKAGDYLQLGTGLDTHLHKNLTDADTDGSGNATLDIWPRLRTAPNDNSAVVMTNAKGLWRMASNDMQWQLSNPTLYGIDFQVIEEI